MEVTPLAISDVLVLKPKRFGDARGYFVESYNRRQMAANSLEFDFCQDNTSLSQQRGTIRGLHFQTAPSAQTKLLNVLRGAILDVVVDIRNGSPTYGRHVAVELSEENGLQLLVPRGFAHGFCTLVPDTMVQYKVDNFYDPKADAGLLWNDPALGIAWPVRSDEAILTDKDRKHPTLAELPAHFTYDGRSV
jgi:dTDP-4-dehydrorhamnose 3,5-epimerase